MARTESEIYNAILDDKVAEAGLAELNSSSNTAIWRLWAWITAKAIHLHEQIFDKHKVEVEALIATAVPGTAAWYKAQALEFQFGYDLELDANNKPYYPVVDDDPIFVKVVNRVAVVEGADALQFKVSKTAGSNTLGPLSALEVTAFEEYLNQVKFAGTKTQVISLEGDRLRLKDDGLGNYGTFYYNAAYDEQDVMDAVDAAVDAYLLSLQYNGYLYKSRLEDILQGVTGWVDHDLTGWEVATAAGSWSDLGRRYQPLSGYLNLSGAALSTLLSFEPVTDPGA